MGKTIITYLIDGDPERESTSAQLLVNSRELVGNCNTLSG